MGGGIFVSLFQDLTAKRKEREEFKKDLVTQLQHTNYESLRLVCDARNIPGVFYEYLGSNIEVRSIADCGSSSRALHRGTTSCFKRSTAGPTSQNHLQGKFNAYGVAYIPSRRR